MSKAILVLGATGKQGGGVLRALLQHESFSPSAYTIYAATRDPSSASAQRLAALSPSVKPVLGNLNDVGATIKALPTAPWAVFAITYPGKQEQAEGISAIDAAVAAGSSHIVFSAVDRGPGSPPTDVGHFRTKHHIEERLRTASEQSNGKLTYTIIRPPFFLDNLEPGFFGRVFATLWRDKVKVPLTVIDTADIGVFGAAAIMESDSPLYRNAELDIAGDKLTFETANQIFLEKTSKNIPTSYGFWVSLLFLLMPDIKHMADFFNDPGFAGDVEKSNKLRHMTNFAGWVEHSKHAKKNA